MTINSVPVAEQLLILKVTDDGGTLTATLTYESQIYDAIHGVSFVDNTVTASIFTVTSSTSVTQLNLLESSTLQDLLNAAACRQNKQIPSDYVSSTSDLFGQFSYTRKQLDSTLGTDNDLMLTEDNSADDYISVESDKVSYHY